MKPVLLSWLVFLTPLAVRAAEIPKNTHVLLRMMNSISTRTAQEGTQVYLQTASPISDGQRIIVPVGSYVQGTVLVAKRSGKVAGRAELAIRLEVLTLPGGKTLKFSPHVSSVDDGESQLRRSSTMKAWSSKAAQSARMSNGSRSWPGAEPESAALRIVTGAEPESEQPPEAQSASQRRC